MLPILFIYMIFENNFMPFVENTASSALETFKKPSFGSVTQGSAFAVGVFEEFVILVFISWILPNNLTTVYSIYLCNSLYSFIS